MQYKCEGDYLCCSGQGDWEDEGRVPFLSLLEKLTKSSQALVSTHKLMEDYSIKTYLEGWIADFYLVLGLKVLTCTSNSFGGMDVKLFFHSKR